MPDVRGEAEISDCGRYRYRLSRWWGDGPALPFVMLNPSTADASLDDPTIRRCIGFARREGCGGILVANRYGYRATDPDELRAVADPFGPGNDAALLHIALSAGESGQPIVCAWGAKGGTESRTASILLRGGARLVCLGMTKDGHPRHPLYVRADQPLVAYR
jgi:hypothetical protein